MHIEKKTLRNIFLGILACILLYWLLNETERVLIIYMVLKRVFAPFVFGGVLAFILNVPTRAFEGLFKKVKNGNARRCLAILMTFLAIALILTGVFLLLIPELSATIQNLKPELYTFFTNTEAAVKNLIGNNPELLQWLTENTNFESFNWSSLAQRAVSLIGNSISTIVTGAFSAISSVTVAMYDFIISVVFAIYCLFQKETLARQGRKLLYAYLPEKVSDMIIRILRLTNSTFSNFLSGQCIEVCILGCLFAASMAIFRMPHIALISVIIALTAFIPVVGAWVGCIIGAFLILVANLSNPLPVVWFVIMFVVIQQIENNLIYPKVVGHSIGLSGMWVLVAVAIGGEFMGVAGMFLMIPIVSVIQTLLREFASARLAKKNIPEEKLIAQPPDIQSKLKQHVEKKKAKSKGRNKSTGSSEKQK